ncbi:hypothetical protein GC194_00260 [bacterium]|nr:hypothetical protein [bacterium]
MKVLSFLALLLACIPGFSQSTESVFWNDSLRSYEHRLVQIGDSMVNSTSQFVRQESAKQFIQVFRQALKIPESYHYGFDSLVFMSKLRPEDDAFRLFTWILRLDGNKYRYFGVVHMNDPRRFVYHPLFDRSANEVPGLAEETGPNAWIVDSVYNNQHWFGMFYRDIGLVKKKKFFGLKNEKYYVLIGWDGNNNIGVKGIIDVLHFENGIPIFGAPIFEMEGKTQTRIVLEHNARASLTIKWHPNDEMVSFDHLVPPSEQNKGNAFTYIPSGQYDYIIWKNGKWVFHEDLFNTYNKSVDEAL